MWHDCLHQLNTIFSLLCRRLKRNVLFADGRALQFIWRAEWELFVHHFTKWWSNFMYRHMLPKYIFEKFPQHSGCNRASLAWLVHFPRNEKTRVTYVRTTTLRSSVGPDVSGWNGFWEEQKSQSSVTFFIYSKACTGRLKTRKLGLDTSV